MDNERRFYTYAYLREDGTPYYIGKGTGRRAFNPNRTIKKPPTRGRILFLKTNLTEEEAFKHEIYLIAVLGRKDLGTGILYNFTDGGEGTSGYVRSPENCRQISKTLTGRKLSEEHRRNISCGGMGKKQSKETTEKIKQSLLGHPVSLETREKLRQARTGTKHSPETREKMRKAHSGKVGRPHSEETKEKLRQAALQQWGRKRAEGG